MLLCTEDVEQALTTPMLLQSQNKRKVSTKTNIYFLTLCAYAQTILGKRPGTDTDTRAQQLRLARTHSTHDAHETKTKTKRGRCPGYGSGQAVLTPLNLRLTKVFCTYGIVQNKAQRVKLESDRAHLDHLEALAAMHVDIAHASALLGKWVELSEGGSTGLQTESIGH